MPKQSSLPPMTAVGPAPVRLLWLNSPANPTGTVIAPDLSNLLEGARTVRPGKVPPEERTR